MTTDFYHQHTYGFPGGKRNKDHVSIIGTVSPGFRWGTIRPGFLRLLRNDGLPVSEWNNKSSYWLRKTLKAILCLLVTREKRFCDKPKEHLFQARSSSALRVNLSRSWEGSKDRLCQAVRKDYMTSWKKSKLLRSRFLGSSRNPPPSRDEQRLKQEREDLDV